MGNHVIEASQVSLHGVRMQQQTLSKWHPFWHGDMPKVCECRGEVDENSVPQFTAGYNNLNVVIDIVSADIVHSHV